MSFNVTLLRVIALVDSLPLLTALGGRWLLLLALLLRRGDGGRHARRVARLDTSHQDPAGRPVSDETRMASEAHISPESVPRVATLRRRVRGHGSNHYHRHIVKRYLMMASRESVATAAVRHSMSPMSGL